MPKVASARYDGATAKIQCRSECKLGLDIFGKLTGCETWRGCRIAGNRRGLSATADTAVAMIADSYYTLAILDAQIAINNRTFGKLAVYLCVRSEALKKVGKGNEAGVLQVKRDETESSQLAICKSIAEGTPLSAIYMPSHAIERSDLTKASSPDTISVGVLHAVAFQPPLMCVRAEMEVAQAVLRHPRSPVYFLTLLSCN